MSEEQAMARGKAGKRKPLGLMIGLGTIGACGAYLAIAASAYEVKLARKVNVAGVDVGGLTVPAAREKLTAWWATESQREILFKSAKLTKVPSGFSAEELGAQFDLDSTLDQAPKDDFLEHLKERVGQRAPSDVSVSPTITFDAAKLDAFEKAVNGNVPNNRPARAFLVDGQVKTEFEVAGLRLDREAMSSLLAGAMDSAEPIEIPLTEQDKRIPDRELEKIAAITSEFSTKFNAGQVSRSSNIKRAAELINGLILLPGETFSFNGHLGRRTTAKGFKLAGVYVSGRHDFDIGGGICQVSTTLYNAALLANLKIVSRSPHSLPVPYVPIGRDAAVSYPNPDLKIQNNRDHPIAIAATYEPGRLHFAILGQPNDVEIKIERQEMGSWSNGTKIVHDGSLAYGVQKVVDRGGNGHKVATVKVVYRNGVEVERIPLGTSTYSGGPRIIAVNKNAKPPVKTDPAGSGQTPPAQGGDSVPPVTPPATGGPGG